VEILRSDFQAPDRFLFRIEESMTNQPKRMRPTTALGIWSVALIACMPLLLVIGTSFASSFYRSVPAGDTIWADFAARPALALTSLAGVSAGILAFITGFLAIIRLKERALLVYISTATGSLVLLFLAGELLFSA
jgi:hypothetical protein